MTQYHVTLKTVTNSTYRSGLIVVWCVSLFPPFLEGSNPTQTYRYLHGGWITTQTIWKLPQDKVLWASSGKNAFTKTTQNGECRKEAVPGWLAASVLKLYPRMHKWVEIFPTVTPNKETCLHAEATCYQLCCAGDSNGANFIKARFRQNRNPSKNKIIELNSHSFPEVDKV